MRSLAWWEGAITWASLTQRYEEFGGDGEIPGISWSTDGRPSYARTGEVDAIDGCVIVLSPWAVRNLSFDERISGRHGYDVDICLQARAAGKQVVTADLRVIHHHSLELLGDPEGWIQTHMALADKWEAQLDAGGADARLARPRPARRGRGVGLPAADGRRRAAAKRRQGQAARHLAQLELDLDRAAAAAARAGSGGLASEVAGGRARACAPAVLGLGEPDPVAARARARGCARSSSTSMSPAASSSSSATRSSREMLARPRCLIADSRSASAKAVESAYGSSRPISR